MSSFTDQNSFNVTYKNILTNTEYEGKIWIVKINREKFANAIDKLTADELTDVFSKFDKDEKSCVAILTGADKYFCGGADLKQVDKDLSKILEKGLNSDSNSKSGNSGMNDISRNKAPLGISRMKLSKPVIAAINGPAVAGGFELTLWCDLRVTYRDSIMGVFCRRFGVPLIDGGTYRLPILIGLSRAMDLILTGRTIKGEEAFNIGLVNRIVDTSSDVLEEAMNLAKELCDLPQTCMRNDRLSLLDNAYYPGLDSLIQREFGYGLKSLLSKEAVKGSQLFTQGYGKHGKALKGKPKF